MKVEMNPGSKATIRLNGHTCEGIVQSKDGDIWTLWTGRKMIVVHQCFIIRDSLPETGQCKGCDQLVRTDDMQGNDQVGYEWCARCWEEVGK